MGKVEPIDQQLFTQTEKSGKNDVKVGMNEQWLSQKMSLHLHTLYVLWISDHYHRDEWYVKSFFEFSFWKFYGQSVTGNFNP